MTRHTTGPMISLKSNLVYNLLFTGTNIVYPLISFAYVSRILGPATLGKVSFVVALVSYFVLIASAGIPLYGSREIARVRTNTSEMNATFSELFAINGVSTIVTAVLFVFTLALFPVFRKDMVLFLIVGSTILFNMMSIDWFYQGVENYRFISVRNFVVKTAFLLLLVLLVHSEQDYILYAVLIVGSTLMYNVIAMITLGKYVRFGIQTPSLKRHLRPLSMLFASALTASVYVYLDTVLVGILAGDKAVGLYSAAIKIDKVIVAMVTSVGTVVVPRVSFYLEQSLEKDYKRVTQKSIRLMYLVAFPSAIGAAILAPQIISVVAGPKFSEAVNALRIAAALIPIIGFTNFLGIQVLVSNREEKGLFLATLAASVANILLNLLLIPRYAQNGAAIASVAAEFVALVVIVLWARKGLIKFTLVDFQSLKYLTMSMLMGAILLPISHKLGGGPLSLLCCCSCGVALYFGGLLLLKDRIAGEIVAIPLETIGRLREKYCNERGTI